MNDNLN